MHEATQHALDRIHMKADYFVDVQLWPTSDEFDPLGWLGNFPDEDKPLAAVLLDSFLFFSARMTDGMFSAAVQATSNRFIMGTRRDSKRAWSRYLDSALFCLVTGEVPNPTDSGYLFARRVRQLLGVDEDRVVEPRTCLEHLANSLSPVIFVDDFVGSGNQFVEMWFRQYGLNSGRPLSFAEIARGNPRAGWLFTYCPVLSSRLGADRLRSTCPEVYLSPAHVLDPRSSPLHAESLVFPEDLRAPGRDLIRRISLDVLGLPDTDGAVVNDWQGFHKLGCTVAFSHGIPDATLPIFYHSTPSWTPLKRRT